VWRGAIVGISTGTSSGRTAEVRPSRRARSEVTVSRLLQQVRRLWRRYPRIQLALRAAIAAVAASLLLQLLPMTVERPYYAPFGAVLATTFTLAGSARESLQAVTAIACGGAIAWLARSALEGSTLPLVAMVTAAGVLAAGWRVLGSSGAWVPTAALFTLIVGLTLAGAVVGIATNAVFPPLPISPAVRSLDVLQGRLADDLRGLAHRVRSGEAGSEEVGSTTLSLRSEADAAVRLAVESGRVNLRARGYRDTLRGVQTRSRVLQRVAEMRREVERHLAAAAQEQVDGDVAREDARLVAAALDELSGCLGPDVGSSDCDRATDAVQRVVERAGGDPRTGTTRDLLLAAVAVQLQQALEVVTDGVARGERRADG
jgi:hypothetical protein